MNKYNDLEMSVLSCILQKPDLMQETILQDKHFVNHQRTWQFMKAFYKRFKTFDITLMCSVVENKYQFLQSIVLLLEAEPTSNVFQKYESQLIELYNEQKKDKWIIKKVYEITNDLLVRNISTNDFKNEVEKIYNNAKELFEKK